MSELRGLQLSLPGFRRRAVTVIAVSPDPVERNREVVRRLGLDFPVLSDADLALTRAFGVVHPGGGPDGRDIPRPASFLLRSGTVRWKDLTDNWRVRPKPPEILAAHEALGPR